MRILIVALMLSCTAAPVAAQTRRSQHWAYQTITRPKLPQTPSGFHCRTPIDRFVAARLAVRQLAFSVPAKPETLLRRVYLDLVGLPPSLSEVDAFLADHRPDAYDRVVDRLLSSPRYGEHWARYWLDLARFADTNGYNIDVGRPIHPYRDWVIAALNSNMPFDQFTVEQIAGDLLPSPTDSQRIATGFHRNTMVNQEGGVDAEEFRVKAIVDRVNTTATVWLASTLECSQCHDHFYDAYTQQDYFRFFAFFNHTTDKATQGDLSPTLPILTKQQKQRLQRIGAELAKLPKSDKAGRQKWLAAQAAILRTAPKSLVMQQRKSRRTTRVHIRGDFLDLGQRVTAGTPDFLPAMPKKRAGSRNRLDLAHWLVSKRNPLTARVTVNRHWQRFFHTGLVATSGDFGKRGSLPSHPRLLNWLAADFMGSHWNIKQLHRMIVTSTVYRQSSKLSLHQARSASSLRRQLAVFPRGRLDAEAIRDLALSASGLLEYRIGGPSVYPPQPRGFWLEFGTKGFGMERWPLSRGADRYRRGIYTFWRRTSAYPTFTILNAPSREHCTVRRSRSNTPLQALATLNDPAFVEAAVVLAQRVCRNKKSDRERIRQAFRLCLTRRPTASEIQRINKLLQQQTENYRLDPGAARRLIGHATSVRANHAADAVRLAAWTIVTSVLLNLDETLSKG